jgi:hypothetical protein
LDRKVESLSNLFGIAIGLFENREGCQLVKCDLAKVAKTRIAYLR